MIIRSILTLGLVSRVESKEQKRCASDSESDDLDIVVDDVLMLYDTASHASLPTLVDVASSAHRRRKIVVIIIIISEWTVLYYQQQLVVVVVVAAVVSILE